MCEFINRLQICLSNRPGDDCICHHITNKNQVKVPCVGQNVCHKVVEVTYSGAYATRRDSGVELVTLMMRTRGVGVGAVPSF